MPKYTIGKSGDRWQYRLVRPDGSVKYLKSWKRETMRDFRARIDKIEASMEINTDDLRFGELWRIWYDTWSPTVSESSREVTSGLYAKHIAPELGHLDITKITPIMVHGLLERKGKDGLASSTLSKIKSCIDRPYRFARLHLGEHSLINPAEVVTIKGMSQTKPQRRRVISERDLERFFEVAQSSAHYNYFRLLNATGFRPSEGAGLKLKDITDDGITLSRGITRRGLSDLKNINAHRTFPLTNEIKDILQDQTSRLESSAPDTWLFPSRGGHPTLPSFKLALQRICARTAVYRRGGRNGLKKLELISPPLEISLYDFRHTFATRSARILPAKTLQYLMGHSDISVTLKYYVGLEDQDIQTALDLLNKNNLDKI